MRRRGGLVFSSKRAFFLQFHMVLTITLLGKISRLLIRISIGDRDSGIRPAYKDIISYRSVPPL